jgi:hypothetical protein
MNPRIAPLNLLAKACRNSAWLGVCVGLITAGGLSAQTSDEAVSGSKPVGDTIQVQLVVVGQDVPPRYEIRKLKTSELRAPSGEGESGSRDVLPSQDHNSAPLQIAPEPDELPPGPLYVKNGKEWQPLPTRPNSPSPKVVLDRKGPVVVAVQKVAKADGGADSIVYDPVAEFPVGEKQDSMLILMIKDPRQHLKWKISRIQALDTSWNIMRPGSFTVYNAVGLPVRGQVADVSVPEVPAFQKASIQAKMDAARVVPYKMEVKLPDGKWSTITNSSNTLTEGGRLILIPYGVVMPKANRIASFIAIRDSPAVPEAVSEGNAESESASL